MTLFGGLEGEAKRELWLLDPVRCSTSTTVLEELKRLFGHVVPVAQLRANFFKCHQQEHEIVVMFLGSVNFSPHGNVNQLDLSRMR